MTKLWMVPKISEDYTIYSLFKDGIRPWTLGIRQPVVDSFQSIVHNVAWIPILSLLIHLLPLQDIKQYKKYLGFKKISPLDNAQMWISISLIWYMIKYKDYVINSAPGSMRCYLVNIQIWQANVLRLLCAYTTVRILSPFGWPGTAQTENSIQQQTFLVKYFVPNFLPISLSLNAKYKYCIIDRL